MINEIVLENFRKHEHLQLTFKPGLNCLKGANEAGKSSLLEGLTYNWFGSKALANGLGSVIHYGCKKSEMQTTTDFQVNGKLYRCKRSTSGAEITDGEKVICTGQTEVTSFIEQLFGIPSGTAHMLIVARQNEIRGILEDGKSHEFIEKLADFSEIDTIIDTLQEKLGTGATGPAKLAVEQAQERLDDLELPTKPVKPNVDAETVELTSLKECVKVNGKNLDDTHKRYNEITTSNDTKRDVASNLSKFQAQLDAKTEELKGISVSLVDEKRLDELTKELDDLNKAQENYNDFLEFEERTPWPEEVHWEGDLDSLKADISRVAKEVNNQRDFIRSTDNEIVVLESKEISEGICSTCSTNIKNADELNAEIYHELIKLREHITVLQNSLDDNLGTLGVLRSLESQQTEYEAAFKGDDRISFDTATVPNKLSWRDPAPRKTDLNHVVDISEEISKIEFEVKTAKREAKRITTLNESITKLQDKLDVLSKTDCTIVPTAELRDAAKVLETTLSNQRNDAQALTTKIAKVTADYDKAVISYEAEVKSYNTAEEYVVNAKYSLKELEENNALLKVVRAARIEVTDLIWGMVLKSINNYFNTLRGEISVLGKDTKGFVCNGKPASDLSGSTLDILGLAIRFALTRMFLPGVGLQILDEPGHGMDKNRNSNMLGFIAASGFDQTIIVSHNVDDDAVANLIEMGAI